MPPKGRRTATFIKQREWGGDSGEQTVLEAARERTAHCFDRFDTVAVSFSGGKDSTCILNLAVDEAERRQQRIVVYFFDEEAIPMETEEYARRVWRMLDERLPGLHEKHWYCLQLQQGNGCSREHPYWWTWDDDAQDLWVRPLPPEGIHELDGLTKGDDMHHHIAPLVLPQKRYGTVANILGIRAEESLRRRGMVIRRRGDRDNWIVHDSGAPQHGRDSGHIRKCYTVYDWGINDVWTAPAQLGWDWNAAYDVYHLLGIPPARQRLAPPYSEDSMASLATFAEAFPAIWPRMQRRVPGANAGHLYSRTALYNYGSRTPKPEGLPWKDWVRYWLDQWPSEEDRRNLAIRLRREIDRHYRVTRDPILDVPHPATGLSWPFLVTLAQRGDRKNRRVVANEVYKRSAKLYPERLKVWREQKARGEEYSYDP